MYVPAMHADVHPCCSPEIDIEHNVKFCDFFKQLHFLYVSLASKSGATTVFRQRCFFCDENEVSSKYWPTRVEKNYWPPLDLGYDTKLKQVWQERTWLCVQGWK